MSNPREVMEYDVDVFVMPEKRHATAIAVDRFGTGCEGDYLYGGAGSAPVYAEIGKVDTFRFDMLDKQGNVLHVVEKKK